MKILYLDCFSGISGDMAVAALTDLGVPAGVVDEGLRALCLEGYRTEWTSVQKNGIGAKRFTVLLESDAHGHDGHGMSHSGHVHRTMGDIRALLASPALPRAVWARALSVFEVIARAEGAIHGKPPEAVRFHEVGAVDSIVDIVAVALCLAHLAPDEIHVSRLREGRGFVLCRHGRIPVPAPATLAILEACGAPVVFTDVEGEMITPTGAGLVAALAARTGVPCPAGVIRAVGYGAGHRDFDHPNLLRAVLVETEKSEAAAGRDMVCELVAVVDDATGESLAYAAERLWAINVKECYFTPITMKKGRPGLQITVLCAPEDETAAAELLFRHTATIGLRRRLAERHVMDRAVQTVDTPYGPVVCKVSRRDGVVKAKPEYESLRAAALAADVPLRDVCRAALTAWERARAGP
ncbi:MAG: nickel pincer cofactor biosynthesis protein LarC [Oscillospiraceae bacterium]|nr:nickel pincer cofactor biosynthesis protein LarC [Oscillospiraceae bacterium]